MRGSGKEICILAAVISVGLAVTTYSLLSMGRGYYTDSAIILSVLLASACAILGHNLMVPSLAVMAALGVFAASTLPLQLALLVTAAGAIASSFARRDRKNALEVSLLTNSDTLKWVAVKLLRDRAGRVRLVSGSDGKSIVNMSRVRAIRYNGNLLDSGPLSQVRLQQLTPLISAPADNLPKKAALMGVFLMVSGTLAAVSFHMTQPSSSERLQMAQSPPDQIREAFPVPEVPSSRSPVLAGYEKPPVRYDIHELFPTSDQADIIGVSGPAPLTAEATPMATLLSVGTPNHRVYPVVQRPRTALEPLLVEVPPSPAHPQLEAVPLIAGLPESQPTSVNAVSTEEMLADEPRLYETSLVKPLDAELILGLLVGSTLATDALSPAVERDNVVAVERAETVSFIAPPVAAYRWPALYLPVDQVRIAYPITMPAVLAEVLPRLSRHVIADWTAAAPVEGIVPIEKPDTELAASGHVQMARHIPGEPVKAIRPEHLQPAVHGKALKPVEQADPTPALRSPFPAWPVRAELTRQSAAPDSVSPSLWTLLAEEHTDAEEVVRDRKPQNLRAARGLLHLATLAAPPPAKRIAPLPAPSVPNVMVAETRTRGVSIRELDSLASADLVSASTAITRVPLIRHAVTAQVPFPVARIIHGLRTTEEDLVIQEQPAVVAALTSVPLVEDIAQADAADVYLWLEDNQGGGRRGADMPAIRLALLCEASQGSVRDICLQLEQEALDRLHEMMIPIEMMRSCASRILASGSGYDALELCILREANLRT